MPGFGPLELILLVAAMIVARKCFLVARARRCQNHGERRSGWGKALAVVLLIVLGSTYLSMEVPQRAVEVAQEQAPRQPIESKNMQELFDELNQPRIKLDNDDRGASSAVGEGTNQVDVAVPEKIAAEPTAPVPDQSPESLARSVARLERVVEQVSTLADQVSDVGTLVGRAMIVINETIDSRSTIATPRDTAAVPPPLSVPQVEVEQSVAESPAESVAATPRPAWVDDPPKRVGNAWRKVIASGEYSTVEECYKVAGIYLLLATYDHLIQLSGNTPPPPDRWRHRQPLASSGDLRDHLLGQLSWVGIGIDFVRREIAQDEYVETVERSFGPMKNLYTLVEFTPSVDAELRRRLDEYRRSERFAVVGVGAGSVLGLLGLALGLLKVDTWTRGYYTKWLFLGVPAAIIGLVALLFAAS